MSLYDNNKLDKNRQLAIKIIFTKDDWVENESDHRLNKIRCMMRKFRDLIIVKDETKLEQNLPI